MKRSTKLIWGLVGSGLLIAALFATTSLLRNDDIGFYTAHAATINGEPLTVEELGYYIGKVKEERMLPQSMLEQVVLLTDRENADLSIEGVKLTEIIKERALELAIEHKVAIAKAKAINMTSDNIVMLGIGRDIEMKKTAGAASKREKEQFYKYRFGMSSEESYKNALVSDTLARKFKERTMEDMQIDEQQLREYYDANIEKYKASGLKLRVISFSTVDIQGNKLSSDKLEELDGTIEKVMQLAQSGEDYEELVQEYSQDAESKSNGGLRIYQYQDAPGLFSAFRNMYTEKDKIKGPFAGDNERFIAKFEGSSSPTALSFEQAAEQVARDVREEKYKALLEQWVERSHIEYNRSVLDKVVVYPVND